MKHLFLTSVDVTGFIKYIDKPASKLKVLYTPTAANVEKNKWFIDEDRRLLREAEVNFEEFNLKDITIQQADEIFDRLFEDLDILIVSGGNIFYLLQESLRTGFDKWVQRLIKKGVWYVGGSAGAVIAGSTIEPLAAMDSPDKAPELKTYNGFGLVDFVIIPHYGDGHFAESSRKGEIICQEKGFPYRAISNQESILIEGDNLRIVTVK